MIRDSFSGRRNILRDEGYSGPLRQKRYFEGWYVRQVTPDRSRSLAVIIGLSLAPDPHAFIQILSGPDAEVVKIRFELDGLKARRDRFEVELGGCRFSSDGMELSLHQDGIDISGRLKFKGREAFPSSILSPGIMGPFSWVPFMECIHGVISPDHEVEGTLEWNGKKVSFSGGRGYIEKDRGISMPRQWIWAHTNQFENAGDSLMFSVARIPWMGSSFNGHLGFLKFDDRWHRFGTYTGTRVSGRSSGNSMDIAIGDSRRVLEVRMDWEDSGGRLNAPVHGAMSREIIESPGASITGTYRESGVLLWEGRAEPAAVEVAGDPQSLLSRFSSSRV